MGGQESAEAILAAVHGSEGPNRRSRTGTERSMTEGDAEKRAGKLERVRKEGGGTAEEPDVVRQADTAREGKAGEKVSMLMEEVCTRENMLAAYRRVVKNGGAAGIDGMEVGKLMSFCREHWNRIKEELLSDRYIPQAVRSVEIAKPDGRGKRKLGIPTVLDRMIQQSLLQVITPVLDSTFANDSYGFRPGRSAHDAVRRAREHIAAGHRWVVDLDIEKFFDRINHDILMARVARRVKDKRVLRLMRRYLQAGVMEGGLVSPRREGTPQGGPLSPLLSNILLDELDKELERRGHRYVRYADDVNIYVQSERAGGRALASLERFLWKRLRLRINREKSKVDRPWRRKFLGYSVTANLEPKLKVSKESVKRLKTKLRVMLRQGRGRNLSRVCEELKPVLRGWVAYYRLSEVKLSFEELDSWVRRKLRMILWRQWKKPRTRRKMLASREMGTVRSALSAYNGRGPWWNAGASHMNQAFPVAYFRQCGLISLVEEHRRLMCLS